MKNEGVDADVTRARQAVDAEAARHSRMNSQCEKEPTRIQFSMISRM